MLILIVRRLFPPLQGAVMRVIETYKYQLHFHCPAADMRGWRAITS
jgi:hypothetical protein